MKFIVHPILDTYVARDIYKGEESVRVGLKVPWEWIRSKCTGVEICMVSVYVCAKHTQRREQY